MRIPPALLAKAARPRYWIPACVLAFALIGELSLNPIAPRYGTDSSIFVVMARGLLAGRTPYVDLFDHKGPLFWFVEALPLAVWNHTASIWLFELICMAASLLLLRGTLRTLGAGERACALAGAAYTLAVCAVGQGGNFTEIYCLPLILAACRLGVGERRGGWRYVAMGALVSAAFWIRVNNALVVAGAAAACWMIGPKGSRWKDLLRLTALGLIGFILVSAPLIWFYARRGALDEMVYGAFIHNVLYSSANLSRRLRLLNGQYFLLAASAALVPLAGASLCKRAVRPFLYVLGTAGLTACIISPNQYPHYLLLLTPALALAVGGAAGLPREAAPPPRTAPVYSLWKRTWTICACCLIAVYGIWSAARAGAHFMSVLRDRDAFGAPVREVLSLIPEEERDSILTYDVDASWYIITDTLPCHRLFFLQTKLARVNPEFADEILAYLESDPPAWILIPPEAGTSEVYLRIAAMYEPVRSTAHYTLMRLSTPGGKTNLRAAALCVPPGPAGGMDGY